MENYLMENHKRINNPTTPAAIRTKLHITGILVISAFFKFV
jgi:hypothetical protein